MLHLEALSHIYQDAGRESRAIFNIGDWALQPGDQVLLRGVSGSGKTTLLNIVAGLLTPTSGSVRLEGTDLYSLPEAARDRFRAAHIGYMFQSHNLIPALPALENVIMPMAFARRLPRKAWVTRARDLLAAVGLADYAHRRPAQLSAGQRLRVSAARALANAPRLILADEPTAALDAENAAAVIELFQAACREVNGVLIVASHDPALAERFPICVDLRAGRLQYGERSSVSPT